MTDEHNIASECLGVTGAVNFNKPEKQEINLSLQLESAIKNLNIFENAAETRQRREALVELQDFCNEWIYKKSIDYMYPETVAKSIKGKIFTFGSYRLGVNFSGADIDALLVVPKFITRDEFFGDFLDILADNPHAKEIHAVPQAFVPVLKMKFCGVEIDLLFASVDQMSVPSDFSLCENSDQLLRNMDERDVRSVNGVRVTDDILRLVHDKVTFKSTLKIVRIWAKRRCIYSNAMGFLGGVSWAILVARICQLWPMAAVSTLLFNFFKFYASKWRWPSPVVLKEVEDSSVLNLLQWDPRVNPSDQNHVMPILTPSYPSQNSTYNVCNSHKKFVLDQMKKALEVFRQVLNQKKQFPDLFKPLFFFTYQHYLVITFRCVEKKQFREDSSLIESKLRLLVQYLENNMFVSFAILYLKSYDSTNVIDKVTKTKTSGESCNEVENVRRWFIGMELGKVEGSLSLVDEITRFKSLVRVPVDVSYVKKRKLGAYISVEEMDMIREKTRLKRIESQAALNESGDSNKASTLTEGPAGNVPTILKRKSTDVSESVDTKKLKSNEKDLETNGSNINVESVDHEVYEVASSEMKSDELPKDENHLKESVQGREDDVCKSLEKIVDEGVSSSTTIMEKCSSTEDSLVVGNVSSTTEKDESVTFNQDDLHK